MAHLPTQLTSRVGRSSLVVEAPPIEPNRALCEAAGLPSAERALTLFDEVAETLWR